MLRNASAYSAFVRWRLGLFWLKRLERFQMATAWAMPKWLVKWCSIRMIAHATTGQHSDTVVPDLSAMDALKRWP